jgi:ABC-type glutathione transport system ATPase component
MSAPILRVENLEIAFGATPVVRGVSLELRAGRVQGLAGESGSGKTVTAMSVLGLLPRTATVTGSIRLGETELVGMCVDAGSRWCSRTHPRACTRSSPWATSSPTTCVGT